jgi:hypothetical protein
LPTTVASGCGTALQTVFACVVNVVEIVPGWTGIFGANCIASAESRCILRAGQARLEARHVSIECLSAFNAYGLSGGRLILAKLALSADRVAKRVSIAAGGTFKAAREAGHVGEFADIAGLASTLAGNILE